jgi:hypothetical protein
MSDRSKIGLDNPVFRGRLRKPAAAQSLHAPISQRSRPVPIGSNTLTTLPAIRPQPASNHAAEIRISTPSSNSMDGMVAKKQPSRLSRPAPVGVGRQAVPVPATSISALADRVTGGPQKPLHIISPQPFARPAHTKLQRSKVLHRRSVQVPSTTLAISGGLRAYSKAQIALVAMAGFIFLVGVIVSIITVQTNNSTKSQVAAISAKSSNIGGAAEAGAVPSETKPSNTPKTIYKVAPLLPKFISMGSIRVNARILPMSINTKGELQAPSNIYDAGWYNASARPGDSGGNGAMLIDGHVHGPTLPGIFNDLKKAPIGSSIRITRGDDKVFSYKVVKVQNYDAATFDMSMALTSAQPGVAGLNVITCGGPYDKVSGEYTQRTIVFAVLQS